MNKELENMKDKEAQDEWDINRNSTIGNEKKSKADEMFRKLGYEKETIYYHLEVMEIQYIRKNDKWASNIIFNLENKTFLVYYGEREAGNITIELLQAINTKVKELGWNE